MQSANKLSCILQPFLKPHLLLKKVSSKEGILLGIESLSKSSTSSVICQQIFCMILLSAKREKSLLVSRLLEKCLHQMTYRNYGARSLQKYLKVTSVIWLYGSQITSVLTSFRRITKYDNLSTCCSFSQQQISDILFCPAVSLISGSSL